MICISFTTPRTTQDKQLCVIMSMFVYDDQWSLVKADHTTIL